MYLDLSFLKIWMEYWDCKVKNISTCRICLKSLISPLKLPCNNIVCQKHILNMKKADGHIINCPICKINHICDDMENCVSLSNSLDQIFGENKDKTLANIELLIKKLDLKDDEVTLTKNNLECFIYDHLKELQNQLDLEREELKLKIDIEHDFFTKKIGDLLGVLNESVKELQPNKFSRKNLIEMFRQISRDHQMNVSKNGQIEEFKASLEKETEKLDAKLKEYQDVKFQTTRLYFDSNFLSKANENILGSIRIKKMMEESLKLITLDHIYLNIWNAKTGKASITTILF